MTIAQLREFLSKVPSTLDECEVVVDLYQSKVSYSEFEVVPLVNPFIYHDSANAKETVLCFDIESNE